MDFAGDSDSDSDSDSNCYYDSGDKNNSYSEDDDPCNAIDDNDGDLSLRREKNYTVLTENDIKKRQNDEISDISSVLSLSASEATLLLCYFKWNVSKLHDAWFASEDKIRVSVGLLLPPPPLGPTPFQCQICFDDFPPSDHKDSILTLNCSHTYCTTCWKTYIITAIENLGFGCLSLRCPEPKCPSAVGLDFIRRLSLGVEYEKKYESFLVRSYVEGKREKIKWCTGAGCENAVEFELGSGDDVYDVLCLCQNAFCWKCTEEPHRPVDCETVAQWVKKNSSESENTNWILAYSKPCPKCKRPIEKNHGCNHMTCGHPCRYEFCWLCLADWKSDHYSCNRYKAGKENGDWENEDEKRRAMAKQSLERYTHYYERWASNNKSREKAIEDFTKMKTTHLKLLRDKVMEPETNLCFIMDAWNQVIECRSVLKWSYAYGYYLPEHECTKRNFFEYSQGEAETGLERLHHCVERELFDNFVDIELNAIELTADKLRVRTVAFTHFRTKVTGLTKVTQSYFEKLVEALENGLSDVNSIASKKKGKTKRNKRKASSSSTGATITATTTPGEYPPIDADGDIGYWSCDRCTYMNPDRAVSCQMCYDDDH